MTYEEQCKIEQLNKQIFDNIIKNTKAENFIDYYMVHNQKETCEHFGLRTKKQLAKVLTYFGYDFSTKKPSPFKGKKAARSHESYVAGGKKSAETQKTNWQNKPEEEKEAWAKKQAIAHSSEEFKANIKQINLDYWAKLSTEEKAQIMHNRSIANKQTWEKAHDKILEKAYETKKANNSFNSSRPEENYFNYLKEKYGENNVIREYSDERYPYNCDFYIPSEDLFIELNLHRYHGGKPFNSETDQLKLHSWEEKAKTSDFYKKAIWVWTVHDPEKQTVAKKNKLNYIMYYTEAELYGNKSSFNR